LLLNTDNLGFWLVPLTILRMPNRIFCLLSDFVAIVVYLAALIPARAL